VLEKVQVLSDQFAAMIEEDGIVTTNNDEE
jgi:hypothetical protein